jgi:hypothetical protein
MPISCLDETIYDSSIGPLRASIIKNHAVNLHKSDMEQGKGASARLPGGLLDDYAGAGDVTRGQ